MAKSPEPVAADPQPDPLDRDAQAVSRPVEEPDPPRSAGPFGDYDAAGVDLSLLRWVLSLTPLERLKLMERHARDTLLLYEYGRRHRETTAGPHR